MCVLMLDLDIPCPSQCPYYVPNCSNPFSSGQKVLSHLLPSETHSPTNASATSPNTYSFKQITESLQLSQTISLNVSFPKRISVTGASSRSSSSISTATTCNSRRKALRTLLQPQYTGKMDLETENKIAAILMKEAAELRCQAEKDGVNAYLRQQKVRGRPNSRFLTATVLGVQQANRVVEVNEMWRVRQKELELNDKLKGRSSDKRSYRDRSDSSSSGNWGSTNSADLCTSNKTEADKSYSSEDGGLKDEEVEEFLHKRVKRGRGAVGSRMDETGPYLPDTSLDTDRKPFESSDVRVREEWEHRVLGPEKPPSLKLYQSSEDESDQDDWKRPKKVDSVSKKHSKKHRKKENDRDKKRKEKKSKHHHHRSRH